MKKTVFRKLCMVMLVTLALCLLIYPLMLPSENYFRMVLQVLPLTLLVGVGMMIPLIVISSNFSRRTANELKKLRLDSKSTLSQFPELRPVARQIASLRAQIDTQMNELTGQQEQLKVLTDNMQEGLLLVSAVGRVLSYNRAALSLLGMEQTDDDYFLVFDLNPSESFSKVVRRALAGVRGSAIISINDKAVQLIANPVSGESSMSGAVLVLMDVSEREKRDALRREFTSNVSHELKTPLTSIYGIADMMESGMVKQKDISGFARRIRDESSRMITLIEDIIRLSRLDDDSFSEEVMQINLYEIAQSVCEQLQAAADAKHITITLEGSEALMQGVPVIVEEMLYNLCDNAIKYNVENGEVHVKVTGTGQQTVFEVSDTGIGIPQADRERIFERFYRVDKSHSRQIGGTGLGLSIVKHGAQFHNATIEVESQLGSGTTITLFFPRSADAAAEAACQAIHDPLNVQIPGESGHHLIQVRKNQDEPEPEEQEITAAELQPDDAYDDADAEAVYDDTYDDAEYDEEDDAEYYDEEDDAAYDEDQDAEVTDEDEIDETEALFREAEEALDLHTEPEEPESEPEPEPAEAAPKADLSKTRTIDITPISEETMDIKI